MIDNAVDLYPPIVSIVQQVGKYEPTVQHQDGRTQMLEHLKKLNRELQHQGLKPSIYEAGDESILCWFDKKKISNSISIWADDCDGVWSIADDGKLLDSKEFDTLDDFLEFSVS